MEKILKLINGTIFPDLNQSKGLGPTYVTRELPLNELKYKNLKVLQTMSPEKHMAYIMTVLTGLTEGDIDELSADDSAELIGIVHKIIAKHIKLGQNFLDILGLSSEDKVQLLQNPLQAVK